jgi:hypothetical protein
LFILGWVYFILGWIALKIKIKMLFKEYHLQENYDDQEIGIHKVFNFLMFVVSVSKRVLERSFFVFL